MSSAAIAVEFGAGVAVQVGAFGEVLAQQAVGVLVGAALPGRVRVGEVDPQPGACSMRSWWNISLPWSQVRVRRSPAGSV